MPANCPPAAPCVGRPFSPWLSAVAAVLALFFATACSDSLILDPAKHTAFEAVVVPAEPTAPIVYESTTSLPTYPYAEFQSDQIDPIYSWPYKRLDFESFRIETGPPQPRTYRLIVLENDYLKITILPELGGRVWQLIHKPSGENMFYENPVVKPTHWGHWDQLGWLALGGLEWNLPVIEHGYDWGSEWEVTIEPQQGAQAAVTLSTPDDGRKLSANITVTLAAGAATMGVDTVVRNVSDAPLDFNYWHSAALAPGAGNHPSDKLRFVWPNHAVTVHSTGDPSLPAPGVPFAWPRFDKRDLSRLGNWQQYLSLFEFPNAAGPFVAVYDRTFDAGAVRVFPNHIASGSKLFGLGWQDALSSNNYTDDDSSYVELHGGLAPTFGDTYRLDGQESISWRENWYPVHGIGDLTYADSTGALYVDRKDGLTLGFYPVKPLAGKLIVSVGTDQIVRRRLQIDPARPYESRLLTAAAANGPLTIQILDIKGREVLSYTHELP